VRGRLADQGRRRRRCAGRSARPRRLHRDHEGLRVVSFADRHIGVTSDAQRQMLEALGISGSDTEPVEALMRQAVPASIYTDAGDSSIPVAASEAEALAELRALADRNTVNRAMIGQGYYGTFTPSVIQRNVLENPSWYTAYTPYQPEI